MRPGQGLEAARSARSARLQSQPVDPGEDRGGVQMVVFVRVGPKVLVDNCSGGLMVREEWFLHRGPKKKGEKYRELFNCDRLDLGESVSVAHGGKGNSCRWHIELLEG
jgi:hypothetical protein